MSSHFPLHDSASFPSFQVIVEHNLNRHPDGPEELYRFLCLWKGSLWIASKSRCFEDRFHDLFLAMLEAIQSGRLRNPAALPAYAHNMARRMTLHEMTRRTTRERLTGLARIDFALRSATHNAERELIESERRKQLDQWIEALPALDREILTRFYFNEESAEQIQAEMRIDQTKYRLAKSRAKQRLAYLALKSQGKSDAYSGSASIPLSLQSSRSKPKP